MAATETVDVVMPQMGVSVSEGTITKWLKQEGDAVEADEPLLEISTDKVDTEVPSPGSGVVAQILVSEGETVDVGTKLAVIAPEGAEAPPQAEEAPAAPAAEEPEPQPKPVAEAPAPEREREPATAPAGDGRSFVSPVVARIAAEHGVDASQVPGTGRGGRVTKKDILGFIEKGPPAEAPAPARPKEEVAPPKEEVAPPKEEVAPPKEEVAPPKEAPAAPPRPKPEPAPAPAAAAAPAAELQPGEQEEPMTAMRRGIAEHMRRSLDTAAHVTSAIEVDMSRVVAAREQLKPEFMKSHGVNPTYLVFVARAVVETLKNYPWINGEIRGDRIVTRNYVNLGFAVELEDGKGLIVPVVKNVQDLNLLGISRAVTDVAERARTKKLNPDEVQGGTFTITNPGGYGTFHGTPVISQPQAAILGTYAVVKRPWVVQDEHGKDVIAIRPIMNLTLTYDHRLVDGALAGRFLRDLRARLESWDADRE